MLLTRLLESFDGSPFKFTRRFDTFNGCCWKIFKKPQTLVLWFSEVTETPVTVEIHIANGNEPLHFLSDVTAEEDRVFTFNFDIPPDHVKIQQTHGFGRCVAYQVH